MQPKNSHIFFFLILRSTPNNLYWYYLFVHNTKSLFNPLIKTLGKLLLNKFLILKIVYK